jgi:sugar/nucleoside kinase (ribokinase family)
MCYGMATIVGLGGICIDRVMRVPRLPQWDEVAYISAYTYQQGGMVATAMVAAAKLGEQVECIGGIGDDDAGRYALQRFQEVGVATDRIVVFPGATTTFSFVLVHEESGRRSILNYRGVQQQSDLNLPDIPLDGVQFLHLDGYWFDTALRTAAHAKSHDIVVTLDPSSRLLQNPRTPELLRCVDYLIPGWTVARKLSGKTKPFEIARALLTYGGKAVLVTKGEEGTFVATPDDRYHVPACDVPVVDTTGAGDTFHGAFVAGLSKGYDVREAVHFASAVAALKCTRLGGQAGIPTFEEVRRFLLSQNSW